MKKEITLGEEEVEAILKKHFKIDGDIQFFFMGGVVNPKRILIRYWK